MHRSRSSSPPHKGHRSRRTLLDNSHSLFAMGRASHSGQEADFMPPLYPSLTAARRDCSTSAIPGVRLFETAKAKTRTDSSHQGHRELDEHEDHQAKSDERKKCYQ